MTPESDRLLIQQIRTATGAARDAAWKELYDRYVGRVRAYIRRRLMDSAVTDDTVQETFWGFETSLPNPGCPAHVDIGFNASLRFELSRRGADYFVRVFFNGRPVPVCGAARCPLAVFRDLWAAKFLVSAEELRAVCFGEGSEAQAAGGLTLGLGAGLWGLGVVGLGIVGLVLFVNRRKKLYREKKQQYSELP